jgi:hypothetical protein
MGTKLGVVGDTGLARARSAPRARPLSQGEPAACSRAVVHQVRAAARGRTLDQGRLARRTAILNFGCSHCQRRRWLLAARGFAQLRIEFRVAELDRLRGGDLLDPLQRRRSHPASERLLQLP